MLSFLSPIFQGEWRPYGESVKVSPQTLHQPSLHQQLRRNELHQQLQRFALYMGSEQMPAVASIWFLNYVTRLLPASVSALSFFQRKLPLRADQVCLTFNALGEVSDILLQHEGEAQPEASVISRYNDLLWQHLTQLIDWLHQHYQVKREILWSNCILRMEQTLDMLIQHANPMLETEKQQLLHTAVWDEQQQNPLYATTQWIATENNPIRLRPHCCIYYHLPNQGFCEDCPKDANVRRKIIKAKQ